MSITLRQLGKKLSYYYWHAQLKMTRTLWLSLGENCTPDTILARHRCRSFATLYSDIWSTIDHAIELERVGYERLFDQENLAFEPHEKAFVYSTLIRQQSDIFNFPHGPFLALPHANILEDERDRLRILKRIARLEGFRFRKNIIFFYYHVAGAHTNLPKLFSKVNEYTANFRSRKKFCKAVIFICTKVKQRSDRKVLFRPIDQNTLFFEIRTIDNWEGIFYSAEHDDDLIQEMLEIVRKQIYRR